MAKKMYLVTTSHRGVFAGELADDADKSNKTLTLLNCRNVIHWSGEQGFLGLAANGPQPTDRIGSIAIEVLLHDVASVTLCSDAAAQEWRALP